MTRPALPSARRLAASTPCSSAGRPTTFSRPYWPHQSDEIGGTLNRVPKFAVSNSLVAPAWAGTKVLPNAEAAGRLREELDEVHRFGSGVLIRSLLATDVLDRLHLWLYPITLGQGKRIFDAGTVPASFRLAVPARTFPKGAVSLVYDRAGSVVTQDMPGA
jgi:dihydrofolate reductase